MSPLKHWALRVLGYRDAPDLEDAVPDDIGVGNVMLTHNTFGNKIWYLTATYGTGSDHQHIEIKLDYERLRQLWQEAAAEVATENKERQLRDDEDRAGND